MVRNIVLIGGSSHPTLTEYICELLGIPPGNALLSKFSVGETRVEINESVRGKDVYILQSGGGKVNDHLLELLIAISACKTASAKKVTAVLPLFPYSRQSDIPYNKAGAPLVKASNGLSKLEVGGNGYTFESLPQTPHLDKHESKSHTIGMDGLQQALSKAQLDDPVDGSEGHTLVIPKAPARGLLDADPDSLAALMASVQIVARAVKAAFSADGLTLFQFNEPAGGQTVFHLHLHVIPRREGVPLKRHAGGMADNAVLAGHAARIRAALGA